MIFTEADLALVQLAHDTLAKVVAEKRANREFLSPVIDGKVEAIGALAGKMRDANVEVEALQGAANNLSAKYESQVLYGDSRLSTQQREINRLRVEADELRGRLQAAQQAPPYNPEPDHMLDWIERESWADVRYAIAPAQREEYGSLRDAIRHAMRDVHASR